MVGGPRLRSGTAEQEEHPCRPSTPSSSRSSASRPPSSTSASATSSRPCASRGRATCR
ncbi:hypothetical protein ACFPRL_22365 [Pseudoclavibacter helvolus]